MRLLDTAWIAVKWDMFILKIISTYDKFMLVM
jgi:hypothetical protein